MTATIAIPSGFIATMVPAAVLKLMPKGVQPFLFRPMTDEAQKVMCLARISEGATFHVSSAVSDAELEAPAVLYERFILPASEALRRRAEKVKT